MADNERPITEDDRSTSALFEWQATCDDRLFRLFMSTGIVTAIYLYFGLLSPWLAERTEQRLLALRRDVAVVSDQVSKVSNLYGDFVSVRMPDGQSPEACAGSFRDAIMPRVKRLVMSDPDATRTLDSLDHALGLLTALSRQHRHQGTVALSSLNNLALFEVAVIELKSVEHCQIQMLPTDWTAKIAEPGTSLRLRDPLLDNFSPYKALDFPAYACLSDTRITSGIPMSLTDILTHIKASVGRPILIDTVSDLQRLDTDLQNETRQAEVERTPFLITVPFVNATLNRNIVLCGLPLILLFTLHLMSFYSQRSAELIKRNSRGREHLSWELEYRNYAPHPWLEIESSLVGTRLPWWMILVEKVRGIVRTLMSAAFVVSPLLIACILAKTGTDTHRKWPVICALCFAGVAYCEVCSIMSAVRKIRNVTCKIEGGKQ